MGTPSGNGITGLTERLAAVGGWVDADPTPSGGYRLRAECLPAEGGQDVTGVAPRRVSGVTFRTLSVCGVTPLTSGGGRG